ncbi:hypothetical protein [Millisia brevis]|uniref:hypothetical protein n=1 Tax=Millisia brevis TaxID=264148 RepID=UPI0008336C56|nr:hypothetical protein [Millisia brevis]
MSEAYPITPAAAGAPTRAAVLLSAGGVLFAVYLLTRPYRVAGDTVEQFASVWWLVSHTAAMVGFVAIAGGLVEGARILRGTAGARAAGRSAGFAAVGAALLLPYYGAETFALHVLAGDPVVSTVGGVTAAGEMPVAESIRLHPLPATLFGIGLLAFATGAVLAGLALVRAGGPRYAAVLLGAAWIVFISQYFVPPAGRMAVGVLLLVACVAFAVALFRLSEVSESAVSVRD